MINSNSNQQFLIKKWDLESAGLLPPGWAQDVYDCASACATKTVLDGRSSTSREQIGAAPVVVHIVGGCDIRERLPWLYALYSQQLLELCSDLYGKRLTVCEDVQSSINLNWSRGTGARYERHVDSNPLTGILFATTLSPLQGGELVFDHEQGEIRVTPIAGQFWAFDATNTSHYVVPLYTDCERISIPMNYYIDGVGQRRPEDLDKYLYEEL